MEKLHEINEEKTISRASLNLGMNKVLSNSRDYETVFSCKAFIVISKINLIFLILLSQLYYKEII